MEGMWIDSTAFGFASGLEVTVVVAVFLSAVVPRACRWTSVFSRVSVTRAVKGRQVPKVTAPDAANVVLMVWRRLSGFAGALGRVAHRAKVGGDLQEECRVCADTWHRANFPC